MTWDEAMQAARLLAAEHGEDAVWHHAELPKSGEIWYCEECSQLCELTERKGWALCSECVDARVFDDHLEDRADAFDATGEEQPLCHCDSCGRHRQRIHAGMAEQPTGVAAFFGKWPGDETDAELLEALAKLRREG